MNYLRITNPDGKIWIMPRQNMSTGMMLYQPSSLRGRLMKMLLPYLAWCGMVNKLLNLIDCNNPIPDNLDAELSALFQRKELEYSVFYGTPSAHQKTTIQIFDKETILGYCKLSESDDIGGLFGKEKEFLDWLNNCGVSGVPRCLYCGKWENNYLFVQSTKKTKKSSFSVGLGKNEMNFQAQFAYKTKTRIAYTDSDQNKSVERLKSVLHLFTVHQRNVLQNLIDLVDAYYASRPVSDFSACHSDFTPWNMFKERGELFVFDFEYARRTMMPYLDVFHYMLQSLMFERHLGTERIYEYWKGQRPILEVYFEDYDIALAAYLTDVIGFYAERDQGKVDYQQEVRLELAELFCKSYVGHH